MQTGDRHLEKFVEIRRADRQEPEPVEQRVGGVACFLENSLIEVEPAQLAIEEKACVESRRCGGHRSGDDRRTVELRVNCGHEKNLIGGFRPFLPWEADVKAQASSTIDPHREMIGQADL